MKKFILFLLLCSSILIAGGTELVLKSYSTDIDIDTSHIANEASKFTIEKQDDQDDDIFTILSNSEDNATIKQNTSHKFRWVMLELDENLSTGNYWIEHTNFDFTASTFQENQLLDKFSLMRRKFFSFHYDKMSNKTQYFLKTVNAESHVMAKARLYTPQTFSKWSNSYILKMLFSFFLFGLIFMAAVYNGALYLYNREKSFLYYMLMQFFMLGILLYQTDLVPVYAMGDIEKEEIAIFFYIILVEIAIVFVLLFIRTFLETQKYLPFHDKILKYIFIFTLIDLLLFFVPIMLIFQLYSFILLYVVWVAWLRLRQGYKPALFFLIGWFALMLGVFASDFVDEKYYFFEPILTGSTIEALFLAIAISYKMREISVEKEEQKELLIQQSKLASMGEMLGNIAHQWRQPLTRLGYILMNIEAKDKAEHHTQKLEEASVQLEFMSQTIDDFRDFYKPNKEKERFNPAEETKKVIALLNFEKIDVQLQIKEEISIVNHKNEFKQVLLNLLTNAKEVLLERAIASPKIVITINKNHISISDNAGGIKLNNIQKVFEPYFSTKKRGMGIGLYMCKIIVERNMGGKLTVFNSKQGAVFTLEEL